MACGFRYNKLKLSLNVHGMRRQTAWVAVTVLVLLIVWTLRTYMKAMPGVKYQINHTWNSAEVDHRPVEITLEASPEGVVMGVVAPFFNDPGNPGGAPGKPFPQLWDHEVVEAFFLNDAEQYLEVELCPHGQHLVLMLNGRRKTIKDALPLTFTAEVKGSEWRGQAIIPAGYFPPNVVKFNAYAIHGSGEDRVYEALYPAPADLFTDPDFHRLEYFQPIDFVKLLNTTSALSTEWKEI
ncbi:hypothetical protein ScPMuIL_010681 [Solemya velum]